MEREVSERCFKKEEHFMEKMENLMVDMLSALQTTGNRLDCLNRILVGEGKDLLETTSFDRMIQALRENAEEMHARNVLMGRYIEAMEKHTLALRHNTETMERHTYALNCHNEAIRNHSTALYSW